MEEYGVYVCKSDFKFNCAHFIAFQGYRERLHGHNYLLSVKMMGDSTLGDDGYCIDFGDIKKIVRSLCKSINEYFLCPMLSDAIVISENEEQLCLECEDGSKFSFPKKDCALLPLRHTSAEELARYFWCRIIRTIGLSVLQQRKIVSMEITVAEAPMQQAIYRSVLPSSEEELLFKEMNPPQFRPRPCSEKHEDS